VTGCKDNSYCREMEIWLTQQHDQAPFTQFEFLSGEAACSSLLAKHYTSEQLIAKEKLAGRQVRMLNARLSCRDVVAATDSFRAWKQTAILESLNAQIHMRFRKLVFTSHGDSRHAMVTEAFARRLAECTKHSAEDSNIYSIFRYGISR
jgi:hypothetical protein